MAIHLRNTGSDLRRLTVMLALVSTPLLASCQDEVTQRARSGADDYDQGVKVDKQYDEQQDILTNCQHQSLLDLAQPGPTLAAAPAESPGRLIPAAFVVTPASPDVAPPRPTVVPVDYQLAWGGGGGNGSGGGGGGSGGKGGPAKNPNCP